MNNNTARETLEYIIKLYLEYLEELNDSDYKNNDFICGERTAYIECLEIIQHWEDANESGLNFIIEARFLL